MSSKPLILVINDDGITAPGIRTLIGVMKTIGDVVVVAPDSPQSGMGHAITVNSTLHLEKVNKDGDSPEYSCSGTPADCVKLGIREVLKDKGRPDIVVSGINHGSNASINVIYSGTMSAALEAGIEGIPAIGFSLCDYDWNADFEVCKNPVKKITEQVLKNGLNEGVVLNVNIPKIDKKDLKGIRICRQARANWEEEFDKRRTPFGKDYYWLAGKFVYMDNGEDTDQWALDNGYVSVVPVHFDMTAYESLSRLNAWKL
ncbi:MAG: 5'/3'-nucleotidase SurE [Bacteroidota bacterium]